MEQKRRLVHGWELSQSRGGRLTWKGAILFQVFKGALIFKSKKETESLSNL
jgi:hypothetical protein